MSKCAATVADVTGFHFFSCKNEAKYGRYCGVHSPEKRAERAKRRGPTKWDRECAARKAYNAALDAVLREARAVAGSAQDQRLLKALDDFNEVRGAR